MKDAPLGVAIAPYFVGRFLAAKLFRGPYILLNPRNIQSMAWPTHDDGRFDKCYVEMVGGTSFILEHTEEEMYAALEGQVRHE